jgi:hypothetical protein
MKKIMMIFVVLLLFSCSEKAETSEDQSHKSQTEMNGKDSELNEFNSMTITPDGKKSFEGTITYKMSFESPQGEAFLAKVKQMYGDSVTIYLSPKGYVMRYYNASVEYIAYMWGNRQFVKFRQNDTLNYRDINQEKTSLYSKLEAKTDKTVLGRTLNSVDMVTSGYEKIYYYDPNMHFNPQFFQNHAYGHEAEYYKVAEAPYLYAKIIYDNLTVTLEATSINEYDIKDSFYKLPKLPLKKIED